MSMSEEVPTGMGAGQSASPSDDASTSSRRELLLRGAGATMALGPMAALMSACGGGASTTSKATTVSGAGGPDVPAKLGDVIYGDLYKTLPYGGNVVGGIPNQLPDTLDPIRGLSYATQHNSDPAHDWLEKYDHQATLRPSLAESRKLVNPTTLEYRLHEGVVFQNGRPLTAEDVKKTFELIRDPKTKSAAAPRVEGVDVEVVDERTVRLVLPRPNAGFRSNLTRVPIVPVETANQQGRHPLGCGPYLFKQWVRDAYTEWERNPKYWNPAAPRCETLRILHFRDSNSGADAFLAGQMDYLHEIPLARIDEFRRRADSGELKLYPLAGGGWTYLGFNHHVKPLDNPKVREAIRLAIDRDQMAQDAFNGVSQPQFAPSITPDHPYYKSMKSSIEYARDVERAKSLLAQAGFPNGFSIKLITLTYDYFAALGTVTKSNLKDIGIDVDVETVDLATYLDRCFSRKDYEMGIIGAELDPEVSSVVNPYLSTGGGTNYFNYSNKQLDRLLQKGTETYDETKRASIYAEAYRISLIEDSAIVPLAKEVFISVHKPACNGDVFQNSPDQRRHYPILAKS